MTPDDGQQQTWRGAVRAFGLVAATLANPIPKLLKDLAAPEGTLRDLEREPPLVYFSPFGALPKDIAYDRDEPVRPPAGTTDLRTEREATRFDAERTGTPDSARSLSHAELPEARSPVFSFRRRDRGVREGSTDGDAARRRSRAPGAAPEDPANPAHPDPSAPERPEMTYVRGNKGFVGDDPQPAANSMSLLDELTEHVLGAGKSRAQSIPVHPANTSPQAARSREPARKAYGDETAEPVHPPMSRDGWWEEGPVAATDLHKAELGDGGVNALIGSLAEDPFSFPARTPGDPVIPEHSAFDPPDGALDAPADGLPSGVKMPGMEDEILEKVSGQYVDPEAFAALVNDVLLRQARRHGVDLS